MAGQVEYHFVEIRRSDGCDTGPGYWPIVEPAKAPKKSTKDGPEKVTRAKPQMVRLEADDPRFVEWRVKLGILLKQELAPEPSEGLPWYVDFPRGYWLYERSKILWVSGYPNKSKLFKTPQEFGLHLLWLLSSSDDRKDCCCVHCNIPPVSKGVSGADDELVVVKSKPGAPPRVTPVPLPPKLASAISANTTTPSPSAQPKPAQLDTTASKAPPTAASAAAVPSHPASQQVVSNTASVRPTSTTPIPQAVTQTAVTPLASPAVQNAARNSKETISLLFRTGELVWFTNGQNWRLGLIAQSHGSAHQILPIAHGFIVQPPVSKGDNDLRPFYAFTVPPPTREDLKGRAYDDIPWDKFIRSLAVDPSHKQELNVLMLDASKLAALKIDQSYSVFTKMKHGDLPSYWGVFLGAERIEIGDTLRIVVPHDLAQEPGIYMGLEAIIFQAGQGVLYGGTIFQLKEGFAGQDGVGNSVPEQNLPRALREEAAWRKSAAPSLPVDCRYIRTNVWCREQEVKGRFYPTHRLAPILNPQGFNDAVQSQALAQAYPALNGRLDAAAAGAPKFTSRKANRVETAGASIPHGTRFAFEPYIQEEASVGISMVANAGASGPQ
ncbi:hypothetical protein jhhlp_003651 [Lomentospora prolificans]|uniref:Cryptic loci regulator 2 N-terminal domain-containing protein n=1 Tax=Lomentospora prolificans TaxID=41688 RepID=A0A2N3N9B3_9PEZI|nr:hypothetical protein jhhlp_003651 [Lomentospora prolificans]